VQLKRRSNEFERLWSFSTGFYGLWVVFIGKKLGLLDALAKAPATAEALANSCGYHLPAVTAWCSAASAYKVISKKNGGKFWLPKKMNAFIIDKRHPNYLGGQFSYLAQRSLEYRGLEDLFKSGRRRPISNSMEAIEEATHWDHYAFLRAIDKDNNFRNILHRGCKFADIGCGTGSLILKLMREYPRSHYFGLDPSTKAVSHAKKQLRGKDVTIHRLSAEEMNFSEEFDIMYLGESLYAASDRKKVIANCFKALKIGGYIVITEGLLPARYPRQEDLLIMGMQLDFALQGHSFMTKKEIVSLLKCTGFRDVASLPLGGSVYLVRARK
jgi:SAM-dependent methyltransferase